MGVSHTAPREALIKPKPCKAIHKTFVTFITFITFNTFFTFPLVLVLFFLPSIHIQLIESFLANQEIVIFVPVNIEECEGVSRGNRIPIHSAIETFSHVREGSFAFISIQIICSHGIPHEHILLPISIHIENL